MFKWLSSIKPILQELKAKYLYMPLHTMHALHATVIFMKSKIIKVDEKEKPSSIRVSNKTREMLVALARGKESQEDVLLRLIKLANSLSTPQETSIIEKENIIGTRYGQKHKTIDIELKKKKYSVVCTYNDLSLMATLRHAQLDAINTTGIPEQMRQKALKHSIDWEIDLELVNINSGGTWYKPTKINSFDEKLLYLICIKEILEETFDINIYELVTQEDYLIIDKWIETYNRNKLSRDSLRVDIKEKLK